jgi:hypothetical protein
MSFMRRRKSKKQSDQDLLSQVKKDLGKPRVAKSIRKSNSSELFQRSAKRSRRQSGRPAKALGVADLPHDKQTPKVHKYLLPLLAADLAVLVFRRLVTAVGPSVRMTVSIKP